MASTSEDNSNNIFQDNDDIENVYKKFYGQCKKNKEMADAYLVNDSYGEYCDLESLKLTEQSLNDNDYIDSYLKEFEKENSLHK